ncbi:transport particle (TRAPP) component [Gregarina niphandrodes]|uniref:Trafficking protein particle complex subunit n=1 Tax=Gregarina niphandrodes TaxID=110365 RepID=A0A023BA01_GRENI|nr:transport particle (TRAPP) component [Gregarina niphandrodes]EZG77186.1 transport particle (TRAPP) component [Gregarina niphandrodes]|eukprot:XP_011129522.1 transport particle (TRAPP) component [Gregarina niphandrodes]
MEENQLLDHPLSKKPRSEISSSSVHYMFGSILQYCMASSNPMEKQYEIGHRIGSRVLLLLTFRDKLKREIKVVNILSFISQQCWRILFGRQGDLFKCGDNQNDYMLTDHKFMLTKYCHEPRGDSFIDYGAFAAGIIEGILCDAEFPATVTAHTLNPDPKDRTVTFLIKFFPEALNRETKMTG